MLYRIHGGWKGKRGGGEFGVCFTCFHGVCVSRANKLVAVSVLLGVFVSEDV